MQQPLTLALAFRSAFVPWWDVAFSVRTSPFLDRFTFFFLRLFFLLLLLKVRLKKEKGGEKEGWTDVLLWCCVHLLLGHQQDGLNGLRAACRPSETRPWIRISFLGQHLLMWNMKIEFLSYFHPICFGFVYIRVTTIDTQGGIVSQSLSWRWVRPLIHHPLMDQ